MIINKEQTPNAQYVGEIKANKVGIDTKNIDFVASLLTTNLYSNPIQSFLRETVSNGWDSHIEAGNPEPVIISLKSDNPEEFKEMVNWSYNRKQVSMTITIRDFGVGLSPERFANIYTNIGSSTKRDSNDFIGCFGIGRFSCLSCSDSATLNSYHNGTRYSYLMYKDGNGINIDELGQFPTDAKNGLSVQVTLQMDYYKVQELITGLTSLAFFNCIYLDDSQKLLLDFAERFNERKSVYLNSFGVWDMGHYTLKKSSYSSSTPVNIVVGNCIYPFTKDQLYAQSNLPKDLPIYLHFDIGELDVTPNREAILYNPKTDAAILKKAKEAVEELKSIIMKQDHIDFPSLLDWYRYKQNNTIEVSIQLDKDQVYKMYLSTQTIRNWNVPSTCTIKGKDMPIGPMLVLMENLMNSYIPHEVIKFRYEISNAMYYSKMPTYNNLKLITAIDSSYVVTTDDVAWKSILKDYVKSKYLSKKKADRYYSTNYVLSKEKAAKALRSRLRQLVRIDSSPNHACLRYILKELDFKNLFVNCNSDNIPAEYVTKWEAEKKAQKKVSTTTSGTPTVVRKCVINTIKGSERWDYSTASCGVMSDSNLYTLDSISKSGKLFVYTSNDNIEDLKHAYRIFSQSLGLYVSTKFIYVAPSNIPTIAALSNTVDLYTYLYTRKNDAIAIYKDIEWHKVASIRRVKYRDWENLVMEFPEAWSKIEEYISYYQKCDALVSLRGPVQTFFNDLVKKYEENNWENPRVKELQADDSLFTFIHWSHYIHKDEHALEIFADYVYRSGISKLSKKAYDAYKNSIFYKSFIKL